MGRTVSLPLLVPQWLICYPDAIALIFALKIQPCGSMNSIVKARLTGNQS